MSLPRPTPDRLDAAASLQPPSQLPSRFAAELAGHAGAQGRLAQLAARFSRRRGAADGASPGLTGRLASRLHSRGPGADDSRWLSRQHPVSWLATGLAGDSRWLSLRAVADSGWRRQLAASRRWAWAGGLAGGALAMVAFAPAQWLASAVASATEGRVLLAEAQGSVWTGSAVPVLTGGPGSRDAAAPPGRLHWRARPHWRGLALSFQQPCCMAQAVRLDWQPGLGRWTLEVSADAPAPATTTAPAAPPAAAEQALGQWPTAWLSGLGTPWNTLQLGGQMRLSSRGLRLESSAGRLRLDGALALEFDALSSRLSPLPSLGSYRLRLQGGGAQAEASPLVLDTLVGPLQLRGQGQWRGARLRFQGEAEAEPGHEAALSNLLNIIGRRQGARSVIAIG